MKYIPHFLLVNYVKIARSIYYQSTRDLSWNYILQVHSSPKITYINITFFFCLNFNNYFSSLQSIDQTSFHEQTIFFPQVAEQTIYFQKFAEQTFFSQKNHSPPPPRNQMVAPVGAIKKSLIYCTKMNVSCDLQILVFSPILL